MKKHIKWDQPDIRQEEIDEVVNSLKTGYVGANGPQVKKFEKEFASKVGAKYAIAVNNGTSALLCALLALKYKLGKDILKVGIPTFTFIATANVAFILGQKIKLIDCNKQTWNIEQKLIPPDIDLLIPVDVGGLPCDYDSLRKLNIPIIADSAESLGAKYKGQLIGTQADVHIFSLHRAKIITTGEGGMITTNNKELYELMRSLANHGYDPQRNMWEYRHFIPALNFRMVETQASIGLIQLKRLDEYIRARREKARIYKDILQDMVTYQYEPKDCLHPYFFFGILINKNLTTFCQKMYREGIEVRTWTPIHRQRPYRHLNNNNLKNADWIAERIVLLPIHNKLTEEETIYVAERVKALLK